MNSLGYVIVRRYCPRGYYLVIASSHRLRGSISSLSSRGLTTG
ncbi:hypothetical protein [Rickettsia asembonensis]|nr:hypothetical protein [Rickettsia asembonensis]